MTDRKRRKERYEILFEDVNSKMDLVLEGYQEFVNKLEEAKNERVDIRDALTKKIEATRSALSERIEDAEKRLGERIDRIGSRQDVHEGRIEVIVQLFFDRITGLTR